MKNPGIYIGFTIVSDAEGGGKQVANHSGVCYPSGLEDADVVAVEDLLHQQHGAELKELLGRVEATLIQAGYVRTGATPLGDAQQGKPAK